MQGGTVDAPAPAAEPLHGDVVAQPEAAALDGTTEAPPARRDACRPDDGAGIRRSEAISAPRRSHPQVRALLDRIEREFPAAAAPMLKEGVRRLIDYQDPAYADLYLDRLAKIAALAGADARLLDETARHLALWMSYEDTIRVAALKTRGTRFDRVQQRGPGRPRPGAGDRRVPASRRARDRRDLAGRDRPRGRAARAGCAARSSASPARAGSSPPARSAAS